MPRHALTLAVALFAPALAFAAPAPAVRLVTAEAVIVPLKGNPREVAARLTSTSALTSVARSPAASRRLAGVSDPTRWLGSRLQASVDEKRGAVTLRLADCPGKDAVELLTAVVEAYKAEAFQTDALAAAKMYEMAFAQGGMKVQQAGQVQLVFAARAAGRGRLMIMNEGFAPDNRGLKAAIDRSVVQPPRVVAAPVFGRR
jgi:hypothetical protein